MKRGTLIVGAFLVLLIVAFCREAEADVTLEVGAPFLSGEYSKGAGLLLSEDNGKYRWGMGYISEQEVLPSWEEDNGRPKVDLRENLFIHGQRIVRLTDKIDFGLGAAYFNSTNRALGSKFTASLSVTYELSPHASINLRHWSNAGSATPNMGQDLITFGWSF